MPCNSLYTSAASRSRAAWSPSLQSRNNSVISPAFGVISGCEKQHTTAVAAFQLPFRLHGRRWEANEDFECGNDRVAGGGKGWASARNDATGAEGDHLFGIWKRPYGNLSRTNHGIQDVRRNRRDYRVARRAFLPRPARYRDQLEKPHAGRLPPRGLGPGAAL